MSNSNEANPDAIEISSVFSRVRRGIPKVFLLSLVVGALTYGVLLLVAPEYQSQADLQITAREIRNPFVDPERDRASGNLIAAQLDLEAINTHVNALQSGDLARDVIKKLDLSSKKEFDPALGARDSLDAILRMIGLRSSGGKGTNQDRVLKAFFDRLNVYSLKDSRVVTVRFSSSDPQLSARVPNTLAELYQKRLASNAIVETDTVQQALAPEIAALKKEVDAAEVEVGKFRARTDTFGEGDQRRPLNVQQLNELTQELTRAKAARNVAEARAKSAQDLARSGQADQNADVLRSPLIQSLSAQRVQLERQRSQLSATLLPGHPNMRQVNADLASLKRQIKSEVSKVVASLKKEASIAKLRETSLKKDVASLKSKVVSTDGDQIKLRALEASAKAKKDQLQRLLAQFESNKRNAERKTVPVEARVIASAGVPSVPVFPKKSLLAALATVATFLLGLAWIITRAFIVGARSGGSSANVGGSVGENSDKTGRFSSAAKSANKGLSSSQAGPSVSSSRVLKLASVVSLKDHLQSIATSSGGFRTLLAGENETINAGNDAVELATQLAESGENTVLVDWSLDGKGVLQEIGVPVSPGMTDLLHGNVSFEDVIKQVPSGALHVISAGTAVTNSATVLDADQLNLVLDALDEAYAHIIVVGNYNAARQLFEAIEGRFDAGVMVGGAKGRVAVIQDPPGTFLGFDVMDISLVRLEKDGRPQGAKQRIVRDELTASPEYRL